MNINSKQKKIIIIGVAVFMLMGIWPPWIYTLNKQSVVDRQRPAGYALIIFPPKPEYDTHYFGVKMDLSRLLVQWLIVATGTGLGVFVAQNKKVMA